MERIKVKCKRCGKEWKPLIYPPRICAYCKSKYWNKNKEESESRIIKNKKESESRSINEDSKTSGKYLLAFADSRYMVVVQKELFGYKVLLTEKIMTHLLKITQAQAYRMMKSLIAKRFVTAYSSRECKRIFNKKERATHYGLNYNNIVIDFFEKIKPTVVKNLKDKKELLNAKIKEIQDKVLIEDKLLIKGGGKRVEQKNLVLCKKLTYKSPFSEKGVKPNIILGIVLGEDSNFVTFKTAKRVYRISKFCIESIEDTTEEFREGDNDRN